VALRTLAQRAEAVGFDSLWVGDHIIIPRHVQSFYPYASDGASPFAPDQPYCEPLSVLHFLAGCTQRVRLGTDVLIIPYRHPVLTAKILATLDVLSEGRMILGAGVGWMQEEFEALGLRTYTERGAVTNEYLRLFKELWTKDEPVFQGQYYQVSGIGFQPKPVQQPHPPIWIGGHTGPALRRAAELGDGWLPIGQSPPAILEPAELARKIARLRALTRQAGRPEEAVALGFSTPIAFERASGPSRQMMRGQPEEIAADLRQYQALGVQHFIFNFRLDSVAGVQETMERIAREVLPLIPQE
jgi:probable F420-dependent oxidoreductase